MYKELTIRRMKDPQTKEMMRAVNEMEHGLKQVKKLIKERQDLERHLKGRQQIRKDFYDPSQEQVDNIFREK